MQVGDRDRLHVSATRLTDGDLQIAGQDLSTAAPGGEYEYVLTVAAVDVPTVAAALGGTEEEVVDLLARHAETVVRKGERTWLRSIGVTPAFWSWSP